MRRREEPRRSEGAVLLEVLVALTILALVAIPMLQLGRMGLLRVRAGQDRLQDARAVDAYLAELSAGAGPVPAPGTEASLRLGERTGRVRALPGPGAGTVLLEVSCGGVHRLSLFPTGAGS